MTATCPWCNAPREAGPTCSRCGAIYAKAELIRKQGRASAAALPPEARAEKPAPIEMSLHDAMSLVEDPLLEWKLCVAAIPIALCLALAFHFFMPFLQRTFLGMPVHELGHAVTAWFCGHWAVPTLWKTLIAETRGFVAPITLVLKAKTADMLITFGGDGMGMVLGVLLMSTFFFGKSTQLYKGWLRWGFLVIGSAAFVDMFATWWAARSDFGAVPFGEQEGVGLSDATKLVDDHGWTTDALIHRYVTLGIFCLVALALVYAWGVLRARRYALRAR